MLNHFILTVCVNFSNLQKMLFKIVFYSVLVFMVLLFIWISCMYVLNKNMYVTTDGVSARQILPLYFKEKTINLKELTHTSAGSYSKNDSEHYLVYKDTKTGNVYGVYAKDNVYVKNIEKLQLLIKGK